jgi:hypothetical protein
MPIFPIPTTAILNFRVTNFSPDLLRGPQDFVLNSFSTAESSTLSLLSAASRS